MALDSVLAGPLDDAARATIQAALSTHRATVVRRELLGLAQPFAVDALGAAALDLERYVAQLHTWMTSSPDECGRHVDQWATPFLLVRARHGETEHERTTAASNLAVLAVLDAFEHRPAALPDVPMITVSDAEGRVLDPRTMVWLVLPFPPQTQVEWSWDGDAVVGRPLTASGAPHRFTVPLRHESAIRRIPVDRVGPLGVAVLESSRCLGIAEEHARRPGRPPPRLGDSLVEAQSILAVDWPDVLDWVRELVPVVASLGTGRDEVTRSVSYGPGGPILLSLATDALTHAEGIVHEIQHHRFHLWALERPLASLEVTERRFVSPYREDVRPLYGLHLGLHAFVAVNELRLRRLPASQPQMRRLIHTHFSNLFAFRTVVDHDEANVTGARYLAELGRLLVAHHERVAPAAGSAERRAIDATFEERCRRVEESEAVPGGIANVDPRYLDWEGTVRMADAIGQEVVA
jgi:HEXXH motif-containing protein